MHNVFASTVYANVHKKQLRVAQKRARIILALALLLQVIVVDNDLFSRH